MVVTNITGATVCTLKCTGRPEGPRLDEVASDQQSQERRKHSPEYRNHSRSRFLRRHDRFRFSASGLRRTSPSFNSTPAASSAPMMAAIVSGRGTTSPRSNAPTPCELISA